LSRQGHLVRSASRAPLAALLVALAFAGSALAEDGAARLEHALGARKDRASAEAAVLMCRRALVPGTAGLESAARLIRARYELAVAYLPKGEAVKEHGRAIADGLVVLGEALGRRLEDVDDLDDARDKVPKSAVGVLYWTALAYGSQIPSLSLFSQPGAARRFLRLVRRAVVLDEGYFHGGPRRVLADFLRQAPGIVGGDKDEALSAARRAVRLAPSYVENHVVLAEVLQERDAPEREVRGALKRAIALPLGAVPGAAWEQREARARAHRLLKKLAGGR